MNRLYETYHLLLALVFIFLKYPFNAIRCLHPSNFRKLFIALNEESVDEIIRNIDRFIATRSATTLFQKGPIEYFITQAKQLDQDQPKLLFVSHEATRTGAPMIINKIAHDFKRQYKSEPIFIFCRGGEIYDQFRENFLCYCIRNKQPGNPQSGELQYLFDQIITELRIDRVIINSAESRFILPFVKEAGFTNITYLIHEMGNLYKKGSWSIINDHANCVIFPAHSIAEKANQNTQFQIPVIVKGQGMLKPQIYLENHDTHRKAVRQSLGIPDNAIIILGCGSTIMRKGIDIFTFSAISTIHQYSGKRPLYFIWLGSAPGNYIMKWVEYDIACSGHSEQILFIGQHDDTVPFFLASDVFFMTSRGDPFPCVVQEAMAAGLPIVYFENTGGYPEMLFLPNSHMVKYGDIYAASNILLKLAENDDARINKKGETIEYAKKTLDFESYSNVILETALSE